MPRIIVALILVVVISLVGTAFTPTEEQQLRKDLMYTWNGNYREGVYDCHNLATALAAYLQEIKGYDSEVCTNGPRGEGTHAKYHAWVRVHKTDGYGYYMIETAFTPLFYIGQIVTHGDNEDFNYWSGYTAYEWYEFMDRPWREYDDLRNDYEELRHKYDKLVGDSYNEYEQLRCKYNKLIDDYNHLRNDYDRLVGKYNDLVNKYNRLLR